MSFPAPPYTDGQIANLDGVTYAYELANNRWKVQTNDVSAFTAAVGSNSVLTPDKSNFAATFDVNSPPGTPTTGQAVIVGASPTGAFVGHENDLAIYNGAAWQFTDAYEGLIVWDAGSNILKGWDGSAWTKVVPDAAFSVPDGAITSVAIADGAVTVQKANFKVSSKSLSVAPSGSQWDTYIVAATPLAGDPWFGQTGKLATRTGTGNTVSDWMFSALSEGKIYWVANEDILYGYNGAALSAIGPNTPASASATAASIGGLAIGDIGLVALAQKLASELTTDGTSAAVLRAAIGASTTVWGIGTYILGRYVPASPPLLAGAIVSSGLTATSAGPGGANQSVTGTWQSMGPVTAYGADYVTLWQRIA